MWDCVWLRFSICSTGHESKLHENINSFDQKYASISFSGGFEGIFQGPYMRVGNARYCCDEKSQSRRNQKSYVQEKVA